jgi:ABC-2 type transport system ATP-binding protein
MSQAVMIEANSLCKQFGSFLAVRDVTFSISKGEVVAFLGPNGAGKTTTMRLLTGFVAPTHGSAQIAGINVQTDRIDAAEHLGYLPENGPLYTDMTPLGLLRFFGSARGMPPARLHDRIDAVVTQCALESVAHKPIGKLSKGYRQRVAMAQALLHDPEVLIMDEPTSGLDPNQIVEIRQVIKELGQSKTVLFSSHILQEVEALCDRVLIINKGRLVADNTLSQLRQQNNNTVKVSFKESLDATLFQKLRGISTVIRPSVHEWEFQTDDPENVKKQLMELALQNNLNIVSLQSENQRLEDIFRILTADPRTERMP